MKKITLFLITCLSGFPLTTQASEIKLRCTYEIGQSRWFAKEAFYSIDTQAKTAVVNDNVVQYVHKAPISIGYKSSSVGAYKLRWKLKLPVKVWRTVDGIPGRKRDSTRNIKYTANIDTNTMTAKIQTNVPNAVRPTGTCERLK